MNEKLTEDKIFEKEDFSKEPLPQGDYDYCTFINCNFSESELHNTRFLECSFNDCNLSMIKMHKAVFRDTKFVGCKIMGVVVDETSEFTFSLWFENCVLDYSSFYGKKLKNVVFKNCKMHEIDLSGCDLSGSTFDGCDLKDARFDDSNLEKCDFRNAFNYIIDPQKARLKKAKFSLEGIPGLLYNYDIIIE